MRAFQAGGARGEGAAAGRLRWRRRPLLQQDGLAKAQALAPVTARAYDVVNPDVIPPAGLLTVAASARRAGRFGNNRAA